MDATSGLIVMAGIAAGTFTLRVTPFLIGKRVKFPKLFLDWLVYISLGVVAAMISKNLFVQNGSFYYDDLPVRLAAVAIAGFLQWRRGNLLLSLFIGVAVAVAIKYFLIWNW